MSLQRVFQIDVDLLIYLGNKTPIIIQKVLLQLREDLDDAQILDQKVKALHNYVTFAHAVTLHLKESKYPDLAFFLLSDITYTLLYLIRENKEDPEKLDMCSGCCR